MERSFRYFSYIYISIALFTIVPSLHAQEQLTNFRGSPCCYNFEEIVPQGEINYGIARDHQDGVRIFLLDKTEANLVFSNDQDDKITLIDHGLLEEFYYFIHQDRIELFRFSDGDLETYEFNNPLPLNRSRKEALSMSKYGLTIIPESETEALEFYNLASQRFETRSPSLTREYPRAQLDSFILFSTFEQGQGNFYSHNIVSDEIHFLHTSDNKSIEFISQNSLLFFGDYKEFFVTKGHPDNTYFLKENRSLRFLRMLSYQINNEVHIFFEGNSDQLQYIQLDWNKGIEEDYALPNNHDWGIIDRFYRISEDELLIMGTPYFTKVNIRNDSLNKIDVGWISDLTVDTANVYFEDSKLISFNYATEEITEISDIFLSRYVTDITKIYKVNDSLFYFIGHYDGDFSRDEKDGLFSFNLTQDTIVEMLSFGENGNGLSEAKLQKLGQKLLLRVEDQIFEWTGQDFEPIFRTDPQLPIVQFQDKYYFLKYTDDLIVSLYEWQDQDQIFAVAENIPYNQYLGHILSTPDQLIFMNNYLGAFEVDTEVGAYDTLSPYDREIILKKLYPVGNNIVKELRVPGGGNEFWSYNTKTKSWVQLQTEDIRKPLSLSENKTLAGDYLLNIKYEAPERYLTSISLLTGEQVILLGEHNPGPGYRYTVQYSGDGKNIVRASNSDIQDYKLYITDGTIDGTRLILDLDPFRYFVSFYKFEGEIYFTAFDEEYTKVYRFNCENQHIEEVRKLDPLIPQQHFGLNNQNYTLGYRYSPKQNLTLSRILDTRVEESRVSPYEVAPDRLSSYTPAGSKPIIYLSDSLLAISVSLDEKGEELWKVGLYGQLERMTDLNEGPYDSELKDLVIFENHLYFTGYKYGVGRQVWRMPLPKTDANEDHKDLELLIAPNPSDQFLTIYDMPLEKGEIFIFDMSGKPVFEGIKNEGTPQFSHNMQPYPPGMYIVQLRVKGKSYSGKLILK